MIAIYLPPYLTMCYISFFDFRSKIGRNIVEWTNCFKDNTTPIECRLHTCLVNLLVRKHKRGKTFFIQVLNSFYCLLDIILQLVLYCMVQLTPLKNLNYIQNQANDWKIWCAIWFIVLGFGDNVWNSVRNVGEKRGCRFHSITCIQTILFLYLSHWCWYLLTASKLKNLAHICQFRTLPFFYQFCSLLLPPDVLITTIFERCRISNCLTVSEEINSSLAPPGAPDNDRRPKMLESAFLLLASILGIRTNIGWLNKIL